MTESAYITNVDEQTFAVEVLEKSREVPVLVDFWADWCAPCKSLLPILAKVVDEYQGKLLLAKVDTDGQPQLAREFGIRGLPTVVLFVDGRVVDQFSGALPENQVREFLSPHVAREVDGLIEAARVKMNDGLLAEAEQLLVQAESAEANYAPTRMALAELRVEQGDTAAAKAVLAELRQRDRDNQHYERIKAKMAISEIVDDAPPRSVLEDLVERNPADAQARLQLGVRYFSDGEIDAGMSQMLEIVRRGGNGSRDLGRSGLIQMFTVLGSEDERVGKFRRLLAQSLN